MSIKHFAGKLLLSTSKEKIKGQSKGQMHISIGELLVSHEYEKVPKTFNLGLLAVGALTGTPEPERAIGDVVNPFRPASEYGFTRKVRFEGHRGRLVVKGHYADDGNGGRIGSLEFHGDVPTMEKVVSIEPTTEIWLPGNKVGQISGAFSMSFILESGARLVAHTNTAYFVKNSPVAADFIDPHFRYITIQYASDGTHFKQEEQISLFRSPSEHVNKIQKLTRIL